MKNKKDFNIIENVFGILKRKVFKNKDKYFTLASLKRATSQSWNTLRRNEALMENFISGYRRRMERVRLNNGWNSKY